MNKLRVIVEMPVDGDLTESEFRWIVERLCGGSKIHHEANRTRNANPLRTGAVRVIAWSKAWAGKKESGA